MVLSLNFLFPNFSIANPFLTEAQEEAIENLREIKNPATRTAEFVELAFEPGIKKDLDSIVDLFYLEVDDETIKTSIPKSMFINHTLNNEHLFPLSITVNQEGDVDVLVDGPLNNDYILSYSVIGGSVNLEAFVKGKVKKQKIDLPLLVEAPKIYSFDPQKHLIEPENIWLWDTPEPNAYTLNKSLIYNSENLAEWISYDIVFLTNSDYEIKFEKHLDDTNAWHVCVQERLNISLPELNKRIKHNILVHEATHAYVYGWENPRKLEQSDSKAEELAMLSALYDDPDVGLFALFVPLKSDNLSKTYNDDAHSCASTFILNSMVKYFQLAGQEIVTLEDLIYLDDEQIRNFCLDFYEQEYSNFFANIFPLELIQRSELNRKIDPVDWQNETHYEFNFELNNNSIAELEQLLTIMANQYSLSPEQFSDFLQDKKQLSVLKDYAEKEGIYHLLLQNDAESRLVFLYHYGDNWLYGFYAQIEFENVTVHNDLLNKDISFRDIIRLNLLDPVPLYTGFLGLLGSTNAFTMANDLSLNIKTLSETWALEIVKYRDEDSYVPKELLLNPAPSTKQFIQTRLPSDLKTLSKKCYQDISQHESMHMYVFLSGKNSTSSEFTSFIDEELAMLSELYSVPVMGLLTVLENLRDMDNNIYFNSTAIETHESAAIFILENMADYYRSQGFKIDNISDLYGLSDEQIQEYAKYHFDKYFGDYFGDEGEVDISFLPLYRIAELIFPEKPELYYDELYQQNGYYFEP